MASAAQDAALDGGPARERTADTNVPALPGVVALDARGTRMSTARTTLANAPLGSLLHRIAAPSPECPFSAPECRPDGSYFVDVNPRWLSVVIDYLAHGVVTAPKLTPGVLGGVQAAADYLGLGDLALECAARLARIETADARLTTGSRCTWSPQPTSIRIRARSMCFRGIGTEGPIRRLRSHSSGIIR